MPYVCLRVPTGGGKTVMAAYAVGIVKDELLHAERAVALWLVPSKTILEQTVEALRDKRHFELKAADMVKLPLRVSTRHPSQKEPLLADALTLRGDLERLAATEAQATGEYLRPILLIQAERVDACEPLRERLVAEYGMEKAHIKISVGTKEDLADITVQKLREGWDCPFAYVLCSLQETRSATAIEQIVGRVLRLPSQKPKQHPDLNCAYVFSLWKR